MELSRRTWIAAFKLAVVVSVVAAVAAIAVSALGGIPDMAIVAAVAVIGFTSSWVQTGKVRAAVVPSRVVVPSR